jgi:uncharacterized protein (DUF1499 family)
MGERTPLSGRGHVARSTLIGLLGWLVSCAGSTPPNLGVEAGRLAPCPESPNCVASDATDPEHAVAPLTFSGDPQVAWAAARAAVAALPRTTIADESPDYLHAECRSALFGFVDDLELLRRPDAGRIDVRSASRVGYSDLGVNRQRVERLREGLVEAGVSP